MEKTAINVSEGEIGFQMAIDIDAESFIDGEMSKSLRRADSYNP